MHGQSIAQETGWMARWARFAVRRRWLVLGAWIAALVVFIVGMASFGGKYAASFEIPGTESQSALDLLELRFPQRAGDSATLVFKDEAGVNDPAARARIESVLQDARSLPGVTDVSSPYASSGRDISQDGRIAKAELQYDGRASNLPKSTVDALLAFTEDAGGEGLTVEAGGIVVQSNEQEPPGQSEMIGILAAVFILLVAFGSVVAMGLPLATALVGLGVSFALMAIGANFLDLPQFAPQFAAMIGIGVGIDYALFIVTRYREGLAAGESVEESVVRAVDTAGRSVLFAGAVVAVSMLGLLAIGIPFVGGLGIAGATVVAVAVLVALTLLPSLLAFSGHAVDRWRLPIFHSTEGTSRTSMWYRLSEAIQRRPWFYALGALVLLLVLAAPVLSLRLGSSDAGNNPESLHSRRSYDILAEGFGAGSNGPLTVVFDLQGAGADAPAKIEAVSQAAAQWPGVASVSPPVMSPGGDAAIVMVVPTTSPQDDRTQTLVHDLREQALPPAVNGTGLKAYVTGPTAAFIDIGDRITERLPLFFGAVIGLSFLLLMAVFRSVVVPLKAAVMNLLSIGAAYGVVVAIFQWGWGADLLGIKEGPIESFLPMMLFAILFGLSMDYEVFLISRIREEYLRTGKNAEAVSHGLAVTARVITAAAAIMVVVFLSFVLGPNRVVKEFGLGLATAIFVDATIVRLILVPATMELLGDANWWLPRWLDRLLPNLAVDESLPGEPVSAPAD